MRWRALSNARRRARGSGAGWILVLIAVAAITGPGAQAIASRQSSVAARTATTVDPAYSNSTAAALPIATAVPKPPAKPAPARTVAQVRPQAPPPRRPAPPRAPPPPIGGSSSAAQAVFAAINASRAAAGLRPLGWSAGLSRSAHAHNLAMAAADQLSHQCAGEASLGSRISAQGVSWSWGGENIGMSSSLSTGGALSLEQMMVNETPPNDPHRLDILTTTGTMVGVDVVFDTAHHMLWLTEDFAN